MSETIDDKKLYTRQEAAAFCRLTIPEFELYEYRGRVRPKKFCGYEFSHKEIVRFDQWLNDTRGD